MFKIDNATRAGSLRRWRIVLQDALANRLSGLKELEASNHEANLAAPSAAFCLVNHDGLFMPVKFYFQTLRDSPEI
jgi:hypothetical protein